MSSTIIGLIVVLFISTFVGWFFSHSKKSEMPIKVMLFVLYFWISVFVQIMIFAGLYQFELLDAFIKNN
ncbi:MAG: hypothetical protein GQ532_05700 [Methylomarinum sp.]|nr:hypothetical protein [Methylomarinum sp.]